MPITIRTSGFRYKNSDSIFQNADIIKGDKGEKGDTGATYNLTNDDRQDIATLVETGSFVQTISGTDVTINGEPGMRYICGEVYTLSIVPPSSGTIVVRFTSGSSKTILTMPNTVIMPEWWNNTEPNYTYELCIEDGVYGSVMSWPT